MSYGGGVALDLDLADIAVEVSEWPNGFYYARVKNAEAKISKSGNPMIELELELHDEGRGSGVVKDWLTVNSTFGQRKARDFVAALHDVGQEGMVDFINANPKVRLVPGEFIGKELLVNLGKRQVERDDGSVAVFAQVANPPFKPLSEADQFLG